MLNPRFSYTLDAFIYELALLKNLYNDYCHHPTESNYRDFLYQFQHIRQNKVYMSFFDDFDKDVEDLLKSEFPPDNPVCDIDF